MRTFILKQSRPWVEKYDHLAAPWDRALVEGGFYQRVAQMPEVANRMPRLLALDSQSRTLCLEDLGSEGDCSNCYQGCPFAAGELRALGEYLAHLHRLPLEPHDPLLANRQLRELNHFHMYVFPLAAENGLDLAAYEAELPEAAHALQADAQYAALVRELGERYLADGPCLLHGDFFPGSWLRTPAGLRVIDPEFCCPGWPEFDAGICLAHLVFAGQPVERVAAFLSDYAAAAGGQTIDPVYLARVASAEVMRRLIGVAQLPLACPPGGRANLLRRSQAAMLSGQWRGLW